MIELLTIVIVPLIAIAALLTIPRYRERAMRRLGNLRSAWRGE